MSRTRTVRATLAHADGTVETADAGDAAHVHSPAGGQGMTTGIQDAANLAWKLASAVDGRGGDRLLDSYQAERHPVAAEVIWSTTMITNVGTLDHGVAVRLRNELVHAAIGLAPIQHVLAEQFEETAPRYRHSPIVVDHHPRHARVRAGDHAPHVDDQAVQTALRPRSPARPDTSCSRSPPPSSRAVPPGPLSSAPGR